MRAAAKMDTPGGAWGKVNPGVTARPVLSMGAEKRVLSCRPALVQGSKVSHAVLPPGRPQPSVPLHENATRQRSPADAGALSRVKCTLFPSAAGPAKERAMFSFTRMSPASFVSPGTRLLAKLTKAMKRPSPDSADRKLSLSPAARSAPTLSLALAPPP